jgi:hypothetical protein
MQRMPALTVHVADELVALLRRFRYQTVLEQAEALQLLAPIEAASRRAATPRQAHDAFVRVVRGTFVPAVLQAQDAHLPAARILDGIARTFRAGRVVADRVSGGLTFVPGPDTKQPLRDLLEGLVTEVGAALGDGRETLGFVVR